MKKFLLADDRQVRAELQALGAPLYGTPVEVDDLEEALARGVFLARRDATVACVLPLCFAYAADRLDPDRLLAALKWTRDKRTVGFFLELTHVLTKDTRFRRWSRKFQVDVTEEQPFFEEKTVFSRKLAEQNTPAVARVLGWRMNMPLDAFESMFRKYMQARHTMKSKYPSSALICSWTDKVIEKEHLIEITGDMTAIGHGVYVEGVRVAVGEPGLYNVQRLRPLTKAARKFLRTEN